MKYPINTENHVSFKTIELNRLAPRAYFIPEETRKAKAAASFKNERYESSQVTLLSGEWDFKYYKSKAKLPKELDTEKLSFDTVTIPSTWQRTGYEPPVYLNCPYGFTGTGVTPPDLPDDFSAGVYRKKINIKDPDVNRIITFLGVSPCLDLYINGKFVGYGEASHNSYEFDITKYLVKGTNEIVVVIFKWCTASYLEAQDMFRENGIFRDVYITDYNTTYINDYQLTTPKKGKAYSLNGEVEVKGDTAGCKLEVALYDGKKCIAKDTVPAAVATKFSFKELDVEEWNAEAPKLYELYITLIINKVQSMSIRNYTGFRTIEIKGNVFTFNGKKIKLKGVNHHDTHETKGYALSFDDMEHDVQLMKELNVNCVRTSHYPPDPQFLAFCDFYGLYTVDEADIETHGLPDLGLPIETISMDLKWAPRYVDRVKRMYFRDRNRPCITMWSLGNEAEGYKCHDKCYEYLKSVCPEIPVHYEGVSRTKRLHYDVFSEMYTHPYQVEKVGLGTRGKQYNSVPFYQCEYCHAMGVGPGALEEYWDIFYKYDNLMGGCIWEWADHAVKHSVKEKGFKYEYTYGGDHGEKKHDGNFCVDGLMYPDRTPHTGAYEMQAVYRPVRAKYSGSNKFSFTNTNRFKNASYLEIFWELIKNGAVDNCGSFVLDIAPEAVKKTSIDFGKLEKGNEYFINFTYLDGDSFVAKEQLCLAQASVKLPEAQKGKCSVISDNDELTVKFDGGYAAFSCKTGALTAYNYAGRSLLNKAPVSLPGVMPNIFRALLDNDRNLDHLWCSTHGLDKAEYKLVELEAEISGGEVEIEAEYTVNGKSGKLFDCELCYKIGSNGVIELTAKLEGNDDSPLYQIPRFGICFEMAKRYSNAEYYGRGPGECLPDFKAQSTIGIYNANVADMHEANIMPQDNSNHIDTRWLKITDNDGKGLAVYAEKGFTFNLHNYSQDMLSKAKHREDVTAQNTTFVTLDGFVRGAGTASCGPETLDNYKVNSAEELCFKLVLAPIE